MRWVAPRTGAPEVTIAEDQLEYMPVTVALYAFDNGSFGRLVRFTFTDEERERLKAGEDLYLMQMAGDLEEPFTPMVVNVGCPSELRVHESNDIDEQADGTATA